MIAPPPVVAQLQPDVYFTFSDGINQSSVQRIMNNLTLATNNGAPNVHLFFHSAGGSVSDGIALYNFFRAYTTNLVLYNGGMVASIAAISYLGARTRKTSAHAVFMLHKTTNLPLQPAQSGTLQVMAESVALDDRRSDAIRAEHTRIPAERLALLDKYDLFITAQEAVEYGMAQEIAEFSPPTGGKLYNI